MASTNLCHRLGLPLAAAIVLAALAAAVAGASAAGTSPGIQFPGFVRDRGRYTPLVVPGAVTQTFAEGINNRGQIVGYYDEPGACAVSCGRRTAATAESRSRVPRTPRLSTSTITARSSASTAKRALSTSRRDVAFCWIGESFIRIDVPGAVRTEADGVNDRGQVVGEYIDAGGRFHGFLWDKGRFTTIDVPGADATTVTDINDRGQIVGAYTEGPAGAGPVRGFLLSGGAFTRFAAPDAPVTVPYRINNRGQIVGVTESDLTFTAARGFLLRMGAEGPFEPIDFPGAPRTVAFGINDRGQIVGAYENTAASPSSQPSPMRMPMMMSGR